MIRILHAVGIMNTGGIETWLMNIYRNIDRTKIQFDFVVHSNSKGYYDDEIERLGGRLLHIPKFRIINMSAYKKAWETILQKNTYTILHTHIRSTAPIYLKLAKKYGIKTIAHAHNTSNGKFLVSFIKALFQRNIAAYSDMRFACSNEAGTWLFKNYPFRIIKNGIASALYGLNDETRTAYRKKYAVEQNIVIGHIGRFSYQKNHDFLLDIFAELHKRNKAFKLVLVGDGELRQTIEEKIQKLHLGNSVICTGVRSDIPELLQMMDIFVFPSHFEGLPVALVEAQAAGLQCFISDAISKESILTKYVYPISLDESIETWVHIIMKNCNYKREDMSLYIKNSGYDIRTIAKELEDLYGSI